MFFCETRRGKTITCGTERGSVVDYEFLSPGKSGQKKYTMNTFNKKYWPNLEVEGPAYYWDPRHLNGIGR